MWQPGDQRYNIPSGKREKWLILSIIQMFWKAYKHMELKCCLRKGKKQLISVVSQLHWVVWMLMDESQGRNLKGFFKMRKRVRRLTSEGFGDLRDNDMCVRA